MDPHTLEQLQDLLGRLGMLEQLARKGHADRRMIANLLGREVSALQAICDAAGPDVLTREQVTRGPAGRERCPRCGSEVLWKKMGDRWIGACNGGAPCWWSGEFKD
ncbi:MAG: hypothetical protein H6739_37835 [Alphaproteobacteria bacterium]|nr:hypothetical protein [Alphaproteobacteria bacterium]